MRYQCQTISILTSLRRCVCIWTVIKELKRTGYRFKATIVGSRDQLCIHPQLKPLSNANKIFKCRDLRSKRCCELYNVPKTQQLASELQDEIMDIEDLVRAGIKYKCCPYYMAKERTKDAEIVFMPYNVSGNSFHCHPNLIVQMIPIESISFIFVLSIWLTRNCISPTSKWRNRLLFSMRLVLHIKPISEHSSV